MNTNVYEARIFFVVIDFLGGGGGKGRAIFQRVVGEGWPFSRPRLRQMGYRRLVVGTGGATCSRRGSCLGHRCFSNMSILSGRQGSPSPGADGGRKAERVRRIPEATQLARDGVRIGTHPRPLPGALGPAARPLSSPEYEPRFPVGDGDVRPWSLHSILLSET